MKKAFRIYFQVLPLSVLACLLCLHLNAQPVQYMEYFFDTDPGTGNANQILLPSPADSINYTTVINTAGLASGPHYLFVRTKLSSGEWSLYEPKEFFIRQPIVAAEYFFDTDPGAGNGTSLPVTPGIDSTVIISGVSTTGLTSGNHVLFIRTRDASGHWSLYEPREFFIKQSVVAAEYFFDADPGCGNAIPLAVGMPGDSVLINTSVSTGALTMGSHLIFIRTKDDKGVWSLYEPQEFTVGSPLPVEWLSFTAERKEEDAWLTWITASERNCLRFDVERMIPENGNEFYKIGEVPGGGNTSSRREYHFTDERVKCHGTCYYRLKQVDMNEEYSYTKVVAVYFNPPKAIFRLYPNPSSGQFTLDVTSEQEDMLSMEIINSNGQSVQAYGNLSFPYRFGNDLEPGAYVVIVKMQTAVFNFKIIKTS